ncbi:MAG: hypothetical protein JNJ75_11425 [Cyclobacteriaceae bacterium]|nr:hypothetical protein [Cyclobacteriaceae bacterium]
MPIIRVDGYYNMPDSVISRTNLILDTVDVNDNIPEDDWIKQQLRIREQKMLYKPSIILYQENDEFTVTMFLDSADYEVFKKFKWKDLRERNKKVMVWAKTREIVQDERWPIVYCTELTEIKVVDGKTSPIGRQKFKILDYE